MSRILELTCANCGGNLRMDGQGNCGYCEYCNTKYLVVRDEKNIETIDMSNNMEKVIEICDELIRKERYGNIRKYSELLLKADPNDFRGLFYEGVSKINDSDESSYDELWARAIEKCDDPYWMKKMHTVIPNIIVRLNFKKNREELEYSNVHIPFIYKTRIAFDTYTPDPYTGDTLYTQIIAELYKVANEDLPLNAYYALAYILENTVSTIFLMDLFDFDYIKHAFRSSHKVMNVIVDKLPIFPGTTEHGPERDNWSHIMITQLIFRLLDEGLISKSADMDERKLRSLNRKHQGISDGCFDMFNKIFNNMWGLNIFRNKSNKDIINEYRKMTGRLIDKYLLL